jgi:hypothetical protein
MTEIFTTEQAVLSIIKSQDPDLVYVSTDEIHWEVRWKSEDPLKSDWTNHHDLFWLDEISILSAVESCIENTELLKDLVSYIQNLGKEQVS